MASTTTQLTWRLLAALALTLTLIVANAATTIPLVSLALGVVVAFLLLGILTPAEARSSVNVVVMVTICSAVGLATALDSAGLAARWAASLSSSLSLLGKPGTLASIYIATALLTEVITNAAAAALLLPLSLRLAETEGLPAKTAVYAVMCGVSASFLTPVGYATNLMVAGVGGYSWGDFVKFGGPLQVLVWGVVVGGLWGVFGVD
uniref:Citrate transporter-like domain-containing protein n=1 Tax=Sexangularia sp. CB-2014 TaxID=1486929 RepID=A0A7S1YM04_9EUKA|mmetsp:Transcript_8882/g.28358  ORF Transcript_8882/g.28358 Transcript_8882/m.28358 type:complete len:206 (+) Transcript_8882:375-992(+)